MKAYAAQMLAISLLSFSVLGRTNFNQTTTAHTQADAISVLSPAEVTAILPATIFFQGKTAPVQGRNSGGVRFGDKGMMLVSLVDSSGYSSQVQERYQAYLITETAIDIDGHRLPPGAYGCGFVSNDTFLVMDIGGHDLFKAHTTHDANLRRPTPLQVMAAPGATGEYRLYAGRNFVAFRQAPGSPS